ncbi:HNH endonuclease signature motif containing protein [Serratia fonticola]|uniref:HNH endonuclease signature motif containing protein n=1 Tax=Serratia fonticola TaxID=47917 RepID=UPI0021AD80D9|nr:HNH endonuclease signature motif containing protein [Serratia fonticola]
MSSDENICWDEALEYRDGDLIWKQRDVSTFASEMASIRWHDRYCGKVVGYVVNPPKAKTSYIAFKYKGKKRTAHRTVYEMHHGPLPKGYVIDHHDGNGLNNRIDNLRAVPQSVNLKNMPRRKDNAAGCTGIFWSKRIKKWQSHIQVDGVAIRLGCFASLFDAAAARKSAEIKYGYHPNHGRA